MPTGVSGVFDALYEKLTLPVLVAGADESLAVAYMNPAARRLFLSESRPAELPQPLERLLRFQNLDQFSVFKYALLGSGAIDGLPVPVLTFRGEERNVRLYAAAAAAGGAARHIVYLVEEPRADRTRDMFRTVVDNLEELVYITDLVTYELKFVSKSLARSLGRDDRDILGNTCWKMFHAGQEGPCAYCPLPRLLARPPGDTASCVSELHHRGTGKWYMAKNNIVDWVDGNPAHLGALVDISYRKQYEDQLKHSAATDAMTDVFNRKWGHDKLAEIFALPPEERRNRTLCFLDMDGLKRVNDTLGHAAGDEMIINTIRTIFSCIRQDDFIVRWGGDEFVVLLNCNPENAEKVLGKIVFGFEHFNSTRNRPYRLSVSAGLAGFAEPFANLEELIAEADRRMYTGKLAKRSRTGMFLR